MPKMKTISCSLVLLFVAVSTAYNPDQQNVYHLFTRANPTVSNPLTLNNDALLSNSNFVASRRTVLLIHGWLGSATSEINSVLIPAFLAADNFNVIAVDWSAGSNIGAGLESPENAVSSGQSVARFINWLILRSSTFIANFMIVGHSLGAHQAGVVGRNVNGQIPYIVGLDPGANMEDSGHIFTPDVALYTEAIHTNADIMGHGQPVANVDFYPNGGDYMPGCGINFLCNHNRAIFYFGESVSSGGFTGRSCGSLVQARLGLCIGPWTLRMGGHTPKVGSSGIYHVVTNEAPPFSQG